MGCLARCFICKCYLSYLEVFHIIRRHIKGPCGKARRKGGLALLKGQ